jgi:hypothetical protein
VSARLASFALASAVAAATAGFSAHAYAEEPAAEETNIRYPPSSARWKIIVAGAGVTAVSYGGAAAMGGVWSDVPGHDMLFVPVVGPWIALGQGGCAEDEESSPGEGDCVPLLALRGILYSVDALLQLGGLGILGEGIFMTTEAEAPAEPEPKKKAFAMPAPIVTERSVGLGIVGAF